MEDKCWFSEACVSRFKLVTSPEMKQLFILDRRNGERHPGVYAERERTENFS